MKPGSKVLFVLLLGLLLAACRGAAQESGMAAASRQPGLTQPPTTASTQPIQATEPVSATLSPASIWPAPLPILTASDPFGLLIFPLRLSSEMLAPGDWLFSLGETTTQYGTPLDTGFPPLSIHILSLTEVNTP